MSGAHQNVGARFAPDRGNHPVPLVEAAAVDMKDHQIGPAAKHVVPERLHQDGHAPAAERDVFGLDHGLRITFAQALHE